jgi:hypothetical protein
LGVLYVMDIASWLAECKRHRAVLGAALYCSGTVPVPVVVVARGCGGYCCTVLLLAALHQWVLPAASLKCLNLMLCCNGVFVVCTTA